MSKHEFASFCAYRQLVAARVPKAALYLLNLRYEAVPELLPQSADFEWAVLLL